ncbi:MAG: metallophosphoesterase [Sedimentisphaerales bacterium]|nr:metallophosphoesterase [Sedimentisphaerales bacterium]
MILALALLVLGEISLALDLGNRLLGSGIRTPARALKKISQIVLACVLLAVPVFIVFIEPESKLGRFLFYLSGFLGSLIFLHFLFPYRFGIERIKQKRSVQHERTLISNVVLRDECVSVPSLAAVPDGLRFLVVSDLHCNSQKKLNLIKSAFAKFNNETFYAILVLGDLSENGRMLPELIDTLANLPNRHGIFLVRGNHDFIFGRQKVIEDLARRHSIKILSNTAIKIPELGVELAGLEYPPDYTQIPPKSEHTIRLGLTHTPDNIIMYSKLGVEIVVAGHTHGGWVRLPLLGPLLVPSGLGRFLNKGWYKRGDTLMYVTSGLPYFAAQHGKPGEILRLTIKPNKEKEGIVMIEYPMQ